MKITKVAQLTTCLIFCISVFSCNQVILAPCAEMHYCDTSNKLGEKIDLKIAEKKQLAQYVVRSLKWEEETQEYHRLGNKGSSFLRNKPSQILFDNDSYVNRIIIPHIQKMVVDKNKFSRYSKALVFLSYENEMFDFIAQYYIACNPDDYDGWAFFWFFAHMEEEEAPYCAIIKSVIIERELNKYYYGKQILILLENQYFRPNDGRILERH